MTVLAACDLLGYLSDADESREVQWYFETYMGLVDPLYSEVGKIAQDIVRNGIAHGTSRRPAS